MEKEIMQQIVGNYMRLSGNGTETVADRMFMYQNIPGFLPMEVTWINGQKQYVYDISGKITCEKLFSDAAFSCSDVIHIIEQILELPEQLNQFLIDGRGVVIHESYLYYDVRTKKIFAVYYPDHPYQGMGAIGRFLEFLMEQEDRTDQQTMMFIYGLHRLTKEEATTGRQLREYMGEQKEMDKESVQKGQLRTANEITRIVGKEKKGEQKKKSLFEKSLKNAYILPGILLLIGILLPVILWKNGYFASPVSGMTDWVMALGATLFFLAVTGYGAWRLWPDREENVRWEDEKESRQKVCLIPCQGREEPLPVSCLPFLLGSEQDRVDGVITAQGVSPIHARILQEGNSILLMDEESDSGTFYNDQRLAPWQKTVLQDGDLLRFGEGEYVVEITM